MPTKVMLGTPRQNKAEQGRLRYVIRRAYITTCTSSTRSFLSGRDNVIKLFLSSFQGPTTGQSNQVCEEKQFNRKV
jgi:hypothetical protein